MNYLNLSHFKILYKLLILVGVLTVVTAAVSAVGIYAINDLSTMTTRVDTAGTETKTAARLGQNAVTLNRAEYRLAADPNDEQIKELADAIASEREQFRERLEVIRASAGETQTALLDEVEQAYQAYLSEIQKTLSVGREKSGLVDINSAQEAIVNSARTSRRAATALEDTIKAYVDYTDKKAGQISLDAQSTADQMNMIMTAIALIGVIGGGVLGFCLAQFGIAKPIDASVKSLRSLAKGDLDTAIAGNGRKDELGDIAQAMTVFKDNMLRNREMEREAEEARERAEQEKQKMMNDLASRFEERVGGVIETVGGATTELQATAQQLSSAAEETDVQSTAVAAAAEQASGNVQTVAAASEELSSAIAEVSKQVGEVAQRSTSAAESGKLAQSELDELSKSIEKVNDVVESINDVAEQTNLLALNATIEAARAGEAGKGFAVVASEVKALANQTRKMTDTVSGHISLVLESSERAVGGMKRILQQVDEIDGVATTVASAVEEQSAATSEISRNAQEASTGTGEVSRNITGVQTAAGETGQGASNLRTAADELAQQSSVLKSAVEGFLEEVRAS